ncbi:hypothetical protein B0H19DRAFT_1258697 [Mycena capillaripes]|nr:hypothetical protein B0H19DRAFT_1258697 [Mycena capillaripes]
MPGPGHYYGADNYSGEEAIEYASLTMTSNYVIYSTACLLVYEVLTSLDDEIARVWSLTWRLPKLLFIFNRYIIRVILMHVPPSASIDTKAHGAFYRCLWILANDLGTSSEVIYSDFQMIPLRLAILAAQALVVIRLWAIYNNSRLIFWILTIIYTLEVVAVSLYSQIHGLAAAAQPAPLGCGLESRSGYLLERFATAVWFPPVCFEFIIIVLTVVKLFPQWTWGGKSGLLGSGGNPTVNIIARDSLIYFIFIFSESSVTASASDNKTVCTLATAIMEASPHFYRSILITPTAAVSCIAVSRMMINIGAPLDTPTSAGAISDLLFKTFDAYVPSNGADFLALSNITPTYVPFKTLKAVPIDSAAHAASFAYAKKLTPPGVFGHVIRCFYFAVALLYTSFPSGTSGVPQIGFEELTMRLYHSALLHDLAWSNSAEVINQPSHAMTFELQAGFMAYEHLHAEVFKYRLVDVRRLEANNRLQFDALTKDLRVGPIVPVNSANARSLKDPHMHLA